MKIRHLLLAATITLSTTMMPSSSSAAIPCSPPPLMPTPETQIMPLIYRELPINFVDLLRGSQPVERPTTSTDATPEATPVTDDGSGATMAAENVLRCAGYGESYGVMTSATPHFRAFRVGIGDPQEDVNYLDFGDGVYTVQVGDGIKLDDGRYAVNFAAIVDEEDYIAGEMVFVESDGSYYLDESFLSVEGELEGQTTTIELSEITTMEIKIYEVTTGDRIVWKNTSESSVNISVTNADGETVFRGITQGVGLVGGEDRNVLPIMGLAPGEYTIHTEFIQSGIKYIATIIVE